MTQTSIEIADLEILSISTIEALTADVQAAITSYENLDTNWSNSAIDNLWIVYGRLQHETARRVLVKAGVQPRNSDTRYACTQCNSHFISVAALAEHQALKHGDTP